MSPSINPVSPQTVVNKPSTGPPTTPTPLISWLQDGDTLTLTYTAQITDGAGNVGSQNLVININGTNDVPTIDSATNPAAVDEVSGDSSAQNVPATTGTITFTDQDLGDSLTLSVTGNASASYTPNGGSSGAVPTNSAVNISTLIASGLMLLRSIRSHLRRWSTDHRLDLRPRRR